MDYGLYQPFREYCSSGRIWLVSDTHFNDYDADQWLPATELLKKIKKAVGENDTLICLGDCGDATFFAEVGCARKVLIKGNHDTAPDEYYRTEGGFDEVYPGPLFISEKILLSHEPIYGLTFCLNIHGHMHTGKHKYTDEMGGRHMNIVGPAVDYEPVELRRIVELGEMK